MIISDLHIHSSYSRATSKNITIPNLVKFARIKGINLLGTGDFTHPEWIKILKENLKENESGILKTDDDFSFMLTTEISNIYSKGGKGRRIHNLILAPSFEIVDQIGEFLGSKGRLDYDGRPIFGFSCPELVEKMHQISDRILVIPAHIWTPWFSIFGSKSGFDSIEDCYEDQSKHIHALETGLSSDPGMNWRLSALDKYSLVSFSDLHSHYPWRLGREATVFNTEMKYDEIIKALKTKEGLKETIEFFPEEGKYHYDGHRDCGIVLKPEESKKLAGICPVCKKPLTIGVLSRVEELADREEGYKPANAKPYKSFIPLSEIIAHVTGTQVFSKGVWEIYNKLIDAFDSELEILMNTDVNKISNASNQRIADLILKMRSGSILFEPGHDGVYGKIISGKHEINNESPQKTLDHFRPR